MAPTDTTLLPMFFPVARRRPLRAAQRRRSWLEPEPLTPTLQTVVEEESTCPETPTALSQRDSTQVDPVPLFITSDAPSTREDPTLPDPTSPYLTSYEESDTEPYTPRASARRDGRGEVLPLPPLCRPAAPPAPGAGPRPLPPGETYVRPPRPRSTPFSTPRSGSAPLISERACTTEQIELDEGSRCAPRPRGWLGSLLLLTLVAACGVGYYLLQQGSL